MLKNKKLSAIILFVLLFFFSFFYMYYFRFLVDDELYNYGFSKSILDGLVPYVDFNMIIPPFFPYLFSFILLIFGKHLIVYHLFISFLCTCIFFFCFRKISFYAFCLYFILLIYPYTGYNTFALFLFMLLLCFDDFFSRHVILESILISVMILTKHTLGILILPCLIYSSHKKKSFLVYVVSFFLLLIYLIFYDSILSFINYCILGMFSFASLNGTFNLLSILSFIIVFILLMLLVVKKEKKYFYVLCFQIMVFPSVNYVHFVIGFVPVLYLLFCRLKDYFWGKLFVSCFFITFFLVFNFFQVVVNMSMFSFFKTDTFMKGRRCPTFYDSFILNVYDYLEQVDSDCDMYFLGNFSYFVKLNLDIPINKFDIINNGNMGYNGESVYIDDIHHHCELHKCLFVLNDAEMLGLTANQTNRDILLYVNENYQKKYISSAYSIYSNF